MVLKNSTIFLFLALMSLSMILSFLTWEQHFKRHRSLTDLPRRQRGTSRLIDPDFTPWEENKNPTHLSASLTTESQTTTTTKKTSTQKPVPETPMALLFIKNFTKLPQWDFDDVYNEDAPSRPTTCAQSLRNSKDENFTKAFLPNVRLFLHKDNINVSEWNRLSHFNDPFGFMECLYDEVMASVKLIPTPKEPLLLPKPGGDGCLRCAVVGNGGILNGSRMGAEIDAHDYIFRMNGAITNGFEEDVGNRTSVYFHSAHSINKSRFLFKKYGYKSAPHDEGIKYVMMPEKMKDFQWLEGLLKGEKVSAGPYRNRQPRDYYSGQYNESRFYVLHQDFLRYVRNRFLMSEKLNGRHWAKVRPTNGAFALFLALHTCDIVDTYGFLTDNHRNYSDYYFEKDIISKDMLHPRHDYEQELNLWKKLHKSKIIKLYQRNETWTET